MSMKSGLTRDELAEALKDLIYEHHIFYRIHKELFELLKKDALKASEELIDLIEKVINPHRRKENEQVFPTILKLNPSQEELTKELQEEHRILWEMFNSYKGLRESLSGRIGEIINPTEEILKRSAEHTDKEEPLYQLLLQEVKKFAPQ